VYRWRGFCSSENVPSPKSQDQDVGLPVEVSVNCTVRGAEPAVGVPVKPGTSGGTVTVIYPVLVIDLLADVVLSAVRVTG